MISLTVEQGAALQKLAQGMKVGERKELGQDEYGRSVLLECTTHTGMVVPTYKVHHYNWIGHRLEYGPFNGCIVDNAYQVIADYLKLYGGQVLG